MASLQKYYADFLGAIRLEYQGSEYKALKEKDEAITIKVEEAFKKQGYKIVKKILLGSLRVKTAIKPLSNRDYDLDRGFVLEFANQDGEQFEPLEPKKIIQDVLDNHNFKDSKIKKPCVTADYKALTMHIDYIVFRESKYIKALQLAVGTKNSSIKKWDDNEPEELIDWILSNNNHQGFFTLSNVEVDQFRYIVRYLKRWRDYQFSEADRKKVFSIALTIMAKECFKPSVDEEDNRNDHASLRDTVETILSKGYFCYSEDDKFDIEVRLPTKPFRDVFEQKHKCVGTVFKKKLETMLDNLKAVDATDNLEEKTEILHKLFGDDFPVHSETRKSEGKLYQHTSKPFVPSHDGA